MIRYSILIMFLIIFMPVYAQAGFEWIAPANNSQYTQKSVSTSVPSPQTNAPNAFPAPPVISQPLDREVMEATTPNVQYTAPRVPVSNNNQTPSKTGLYINPYPLMNEGLEASMPSKDHSVEQALAQQSGALTPVKLGHGMATGAQSSRDSGYVSQAASSAPQNITRNLSVMDNGLTPIPGGEPAPLPGLGIENAYSNPNFQTQDLPAQYANAVGFGRDLPLELALSQIIPDGYTHRIMGANAENLIVTWEGGQAWNLVLNDMLRPLNMTAIIQGKQVIIQPMAQL